MCQQGLFELYQLLIGDWFLQHGRQGSLVHLPANARGCCLWPAAATDDLDRHIHGNVGCVLILVALNRLMIDIDLLLVAAFRLGMDRVGGRLSLFLLDHINLARGRRSWLSLGDRRANGGLLGRL